MECSISGFFRGFLYLTALCAAHANDEPVIRYQALSEAAEARGQLARYRGIACTTVKLQVDGMRLAAQVPKMAQAYDVIPIYYTLTTKAGSRRVAVEATAFEDAAKTRGRKLYDLSIPGDLNVKVEYLGSVAGDIHTDQYVPLTGDPKAPVSPFPIFSQDPLVRSGEIRRADIVWYKWKITNTGDTILDPEGFGACFGEPWLIKLDDKGGEEWKANCINLYVRFLNYIYPGESTELWTVFYVPKNLPDSVYGIRPGNYRLDFKVDVRLHQRWDWGTNIWGGTEIARVSVPLKVTEKGRKQPVKEKHIRVDRGENMPGYVASFEEFMTGFNVHRTTGKNETISGVVHLQIAPWTREISLKLILDQPMSIDVARVPVTVSTASMSIRYNPDNPMVVGDQPAFVAQAMPGMRAGVQLGPNPTEHLMTELQEMKTLGVNVIANTAGDWWVPEVGGSKDVNILAAQYKWYYDVLIRQSAMKLMGWSVYPPASTHWYYAPAERLLKKPVRPELADSRYTAPDTLIDLGDPVVPEVIAAWALHNYRRWGDLWFKTRDGVIPIDIEDTWGWLRDDINIRYPLGNLGRQRFHDWLGQKYGTIEAVNQAWDSNYASFDEIDPQADQGSESNNSELRPVYNVKENVFHDWNKAVEDWDRFRTWLRMDIYAKALAIIRKEVPGAQFDLRTEGSNMVVAGNPKSENLHQRHLFYSQRRNAMIFDEITTGDLIGFHSDYTTLPYSNEDLADAARQMVKSGIIPVYLPTFNHMRDLLINEHFGREYQLNYAFDKPVKAVMIHCLAAAYPWWKTIYESGGAPGVIWSDYLCDGFVTETQKRELALLTQHFRAMKRR